MGGSERGAALRDGDEQPRRGNIESTTSETLSLRIRADQSYRSVGLRVCLLVVDRVKLPNPVPFRSRSITLLAISKSQWAGTRLGEGLSWLPGA